MHTLACKISLDLGSEGQSKQTFVNIGFTEKVVTAAYCYFCIKIFGSDV